MVISSMDQLYEVLRNTPQKKLVAVWANDAHTIEAISQAIDIGIVDGVLIGDRRAIEKECNRLKIDQLKFEIIDANSDVEAAQIAIDIIVNNNGDFLMKGALSTDKYMRAILNKDAKLLPPNGILSHVTVIENNYYHKLLIVGDVAIIPQPDIKQKVAIANYLIDTAKSLGISKPKLAIISVSELVLSSVASSVDACILSKMGERNQLHSAIVDGPLALDAAIDRESAEIKNITSEVAGDADCLLFPNLDAGNVFYKMNTKMSKSQTGAFVVGAKVPCILSSRGDSTRTKLNSIALCALLADTKL